MKALRGPFVSINSGHGHARSKSSAESRAFNQQVKDCSIPFIEFHPKRVAGVEDVVASIVGRLKEVGRRLICQAPTGRFQAPERGSGSSRCQESFIEE